MEGIQQYQRAVTPTMSPNGAGGVNSNGSVRGKVLTYANKKPSGSIESAPFFQNKPIASTQNRLVKNSTSLEVSGQSKLVGNSRNNASGIRQDIYGLNNRISDQSHDNMKASSSAFLSRNDLEPLSDEVPSDGVIFARYKNRIDSLVVFRLLEERTRNPERLNLDRRQLDMCPLLENEQRLRLLNFQNNNIRTIQNLGNLPNLIFLDLYNNKLTTLDGCLSLIRGLRVLMIGKNRITNITNLSNLRKLDVLDLHSNEITEVSGLDNLAELRVLNLAGNRISIVNHLSTLTSLTELNLRRNCIQNVFELDNIASLQRIFLSHNKIINETHISCLFSLKNLLELSLDSNPISELDPLMYRNTIISRIMNLKHLDLRRITDEERLSISSYPTNKMWRLNSLASENISLHGIIESAIQTQKHVLYNPTDSVIDHISGNKPPSKVDYTESFVDTMMMANNDIVVIGRSSSMGNDTVQTNDYMSRHESFDDSSAVSVIATIGHVGPGGSERGRMLSADYASEEILPSGGEGGGDTTSPKLLHSSSGEVISSHNVSYPIPLIKWKPATQNLFELEIIGNNEKLLMIIGESWEWTHSKRMLSSVTQVVLRTMRLDTIVGKFAANLSCLPNLKSVTLANNNFKTFYDVNTVLKIFFSTTQPSHTEVATSSLQAPSITTSPVNNKIKTFNIIENPICLLTPQLLQSYVLAYINSISNGSTSNASCGTGSSNILDSFNYTVSTAESKENAIKSFKNILNLNYANPKSKNKGGNGTGNSNTGHTSSSTVLENYMQSRRMHLNGIVEVKNSNKYTNNIQQKKRESVDSQCILQFDSSDAADGGTVSAMGMINRDAPDLVSDGMVVTDMSPRGGSGTTVLHSSPSVSNINSNEGVVGNTAAPTSAVAQASRRSDLEMKFPYYKTIGGGGGGTMFYGNSSQVTTVSCINGSLTDVIGIVLKRRLIQSSFYQTLHDCIGDVILQSLVDLHKEQKQYRTMSAHKR